MRKVIPSKEHHPAPSPSCPPPLPLLNSGIKTSCSSSATATSSGWSSTVRRYGACRTGRGRNWREWHPNGDTQPGRNNGGEREPPDTRGDNKYWWKREKTLFIDIMKKINDWWGHQYITVLLLHHGKYLDALKCMKLRKELVWLEVNIASVPMFYLKKNPTNTFKLFYSTRGGHFEVTWPDAFTDSA